MLRPILAILFCSLSIVAWAAPGASSAFQRPQLFMENRGQLHDDLGRPVPEVLYHLAGGGINVSLTAGSINYTFMKATPAAGTEGADKQEKPEQSEWDCLGLRVSLVGANPAPKIIAGQAQEYYENHYTSGTRKLGGLSQVRSYNRVVYRNVYPKIDWVVYVPEGVSGAGVKYDFVVHQGGNPADIRLKYTGASGLSLDEQGGIVAQTELGSIREEKPFSYLQETGQEVSSKFVLEGQTLHFDVARSSGRTLVIDPQVVWATYYGGGQYDRLTDVAAHNADVYVAGLAHSNSALALAGGHKAHLSGSADAVLGKFSSTGRLVWATYFGGSGYDAAFTIALDTSVKPGSVYIGGRTQSGDSLATSGSHQPAKDAADEGFVAKFDMSGVLKWATYYGGNSLDYVTAAACDGAGNLYVGGFTASSYGLHTTGFRGRSPGHTQSYDGDGFVAKFNSSGVRQWGTYIGGEGQDRVAGIYAFSSGSIGVTGPSSSTTGLTTANAYSPTLSDSMDAFLLKMGSSGNTIWSTYYGGTSNESGVDVTGDASGNLYICGTTNSLNGISTANGFQTTYGGGGSDAFVAKFADPGGLLWATYYGGINDDGLLIDARRHYVGAPFGDLGISLAKGTLWLGFNTRSADAIATIGSYQDSLALAGNTYDAGLVSFDLSGTDFGPLISGKQY